MELPDDRYRDDFAQGEMGAAEDLHDAHPNARHIETTSGRLSAAIRGRSCSAMSG
jgi:hypothetical protein